MLTFPRHLHVIYRSQPLPLSPQFYKFEADTSLWRQRSNGLPHTQCLCLTKQELTDIELESFSQVITWNHHNNLVKKSMFSLLYLINWSSKWLNNLPRVPQQANNKPIASKTTLWSVHLKWHLDTVSILDLVKHLHELRAEHKVCLEA